MQLHSGCSVQNCLKRFLAFPHAELLSCADVAVSELWLQTASVKRREKEVWSMGTS